MDHVLTSATIENVCDLWEVERGSRPADRARRLELSDLVVEAGMTGLSLPRRCIQELGLTPSSARPDSATSRLRRAIPYGPVRLTIQGRSCTADVLEVPGDGPPVLGQIFLGFLDLVADPQGHRLIGNPAHGGEQILEMY